MVGSQIGTSTVIVITGATFTTISGPFSGRVGLALENDDTAGPAAQRFKCEVCASLIMEG